MTLHWADIIETPIPPINLTGNFENKYHITGMSAFRNCDNCNLTKEKTNPLASNSGISPTLNDISSSSYKNEKKLFNNDKLSQYTFDITNKPIVLQKNNKIDTLPLIPNLYNNKEIDSPSPYIKKNYTKYNIPQLTNKVVKRKVSTLIRSEHNSDDIKWMGILYLFILSFILLSIN